MLRIIWDSNDLYIQLLTYKWLKSWLGKKVIAEYIWLRHLGLGRHFHPTNPAKKANLCHGSAMAICSEPSAPTSLAANCWSIRRVIEAWLLMLHGILVNSFCDLHTCSSRGHIMAYRIKDMLLALEKDGAPSFGNGLLTFCYMRLIIISLRDASPKRKRLFFYKSYKGGLGHFRL